jgi:plasmid stability protein
MSKMMQIRDVPDPIHRQLKARAALSGLSLSDYLLAELKRGLERPTRQELMERIARRGRVHLDREPADIIREERDRR